jgi:hypothetical protein
MAIPKHKTHTPKESPSRMPRAAPAQLLAVVKEPAADEELAVDKGSRVALTAWLVAFILLGSFALWDLIMALLFR